MRFSIFPGWHFLVVLSASGAALGTAHAQRPAPDSSKIYTFVARMPVYPGGRGYQQLLADLRREFRTASAAAGCSVPAYPVSVNLLVGPSGVIYRAGFVNNLKASTPSTPTPPGRQPTVATAPPGPALPPPCEAALTAAVARLPRLQPGVQHNQRQTVQLTLPLIPKSTP